jgi:hypothetical protein
MRTTLARSQFCGWFALRDQKGVKFVPGALYVKIVWQVEYSVDSGISDGCCRQSLLIKSK